MNSKRVAIAIRIVLSAVVVQLGCRKAPPKQPPPPTCVGHREGSDLVVNASARTKVGQTWFTVDVSSSVNQMEQVNNGATTARMVVRRNNTAALQLEAQATRQGVSVHVVLGTGFHGMHDVSFTSNDRETAQGTIDGRAIAPFSIHAKADSIKFADGSPLPTGTIDADLKQALPPLMKSIRAQCPSAALPFAPPFAPTTGGGDPPSHYSYPNQSSACQGCLAGSGAALVTCIAVAAAASVECLVFYAVCFAAAVLTCATAYYIALVTGCHVAALGGAAGGGPCCPVGCGVDNRCCDVGETCVGSKGQCCSPGLKGCGDSYCCGATDQCLSSAPNIPPFPPNLCCPAGRNVCNGVCCPRDNDICNPQTQVCCPAGDVCGNNCCDGADQICVNSSSSTCCARAHACGTSCCATSESCADANHGTCSACADCTGPGKECCFGQCCVGAQYYCDADSRSCKCRPNCDGKCGGAPDGCGGSCTGACQEFEVCFNQACCSPNCYGKCGGAPDGCGSTCNYDCPTGQVCLHQACCVPDCTNKSCGAGDGCGGRCTGYCPAGESCTAAHVCKANCGAGRADCCGDGSCCLPAAQCYKCGCGR